MKKGVIAAVAIVALLGCKKENVPQAAPENLSAQQQVEQITEDFLAGIKPEAGSTKAKKWMKILGADLKNAVTGAGIGGALGTAIPGVGTALGATVGGVIMGAGASLEAAGSAPAASQTAAPANPENPYEGTGETHYDIMEGAFANAQIISPDGVIDYDEYHDYAFGVTNEAFPGAEGLGSSLTPAMLQQYSQGVNLSQSLASFISGLPASQMTQQEKQLLIPYCNALENTPNAQQFAVYSIDVENVVVNSAGFSEQQKQRMLIFMATARHGAFYYGF